MKRFEAVLFDLGSTLIYFDSDWPAVMPQADLALLRSLEDSGLALAETKFLTNYELRLQEYYAQRETEFLEYTTTFILQTLLAELGHPNVADAVLRKAVEAMYAVTQAHWQTEADAASTLELLQQRGYRLGIISNAGDDQDVQTLVDKARLRPYFDVIVTSAAQGIRKPNPRIFHTALQALGGIPPGSALMVGDTLGADILGARNAGMSNAWITRRADTPANRAHQDTIQPDLTIAALGELLEILE